MKQKQKIYAAVLAAIILVSLGVIASQFWRAKNPGKAPESASEQNSQAPEKSSDEANIYFASNGKNSVYKIKKDDKWSVIFNGIESKEYDYVSNPVFSPDGTQLAYNAELDGQAYVVVNNNQEIYAYQKALSIVFSPDGKKITFAAAKDNGKAVIISTDVGQSSDVVHGNESREYEGIGSAQTPDGQTVSIIYSPDGSKIAYVVEENGKTYVVVNGQKGNGYDSVDGIGWNDNGQLTYVGQNGNQTATVVNNHETSVTNNTSGTTTPSTPTDTNSGSSNTTNTSKKYYRYQKATDKDVEFDPDRLDYIPCEGDSCNF